MFPVERAEKEKYYKKKKIINDLNIFGFFFI